MNDAALPPLANARPPQWSRVSHLDRANYPKPFLKDRLQPLPNVAPGDLIDEEATSTQIAAESMTQRVQYLEKSIIFLRNQHREMLGNLHDEVETLKSKNKELQFKLIVLQRGSDSPYTNNEPAKIPESEELSEEGIRISLLTQQVNDLSTALKEQQQRNRYLQQLIDQQTKELKKQRSESVKREELDKQRDALAARLEKEAEEGEPLPTEVDLGVVKVLINPLMIRPADSDQAREPSLRECESIIKQMFRNSMRRDQEIQHLRADLKDVLYRHKWHPEGLTSAKTVISNTSQSDSFNPAQNAASGGKLGVPVGAEAMATDLDTKTVMQGQKILPLKNMAHPQRKLNRQPMKRTPELPIHREPSVLLQRRLRPELPNSHFVTKDTVSLPALKQTLGTKAVERRRRTQVLQKARASAPPVQTTHPHPPPNDKP